MAESLDDMISELSELRGAVESLAARVEQLAGEGGGGGIPLPAAGAPDDVALTGLPAAGGKVRITVVTGIGYSSSSGRHGWTGRLSASTLTLDLAVPPGGASSASSASASWSSSSFTVLDYVPEEI